MKNDRESRIFLILPLLVRVGAIALLAIAFYFYFFYKKSNPSPDELYEKHFEPYEMTMSPDSISPLYASAIKAYEGNEFRRAVVLWDSIIQLHPHDNAATFYRGLSYLALDEGSKAIPDLQKVWQQGNLFQEEAGWYLLLAYLQTNNTEISCEIIQQLSAQKFRKSEIEEIGLYMDCTN